MQGMRRVVGGVVRAFARVYARERAATLLLLSVLAAGGASANIAVPSGGQASTSHPISVPPGIAGMAPNLSLNFSDGGVNGPVGVGWSVQGIATITRCPASIPTDGTARGVEFGTQDKLCLDGQRLIQTNDSGVVAASQIDDAKGLSSGHREYRTEKDSYARIRAYGAAGWGATFTGAIISAVIGGTASTLGGGKFASGAQSGAFSYEASRRVDRRRLARPPVQQGPEAAEVEVRQPAAPTPPILLIQWTSGESS